MSEDERNIQIVFFEDCNPCLYCLCPFWSLDQSTINRYKQQGYQDAIFQTCFLELIKRYKCLKVFNIWSSRTFVVFSTSNSSVCRPVVASGTIFSFFFRCSTNRWDQLILFPSCIKIALCFFDTGRTRGTLALSSTERKNTFSYENKDVSSLVCFTEAIAKWQPTCFFRRLFWAQESLTWTTFTCRFASQCLAFFVFGSNLKKIELWKWMQRKNL